jgi:hypothetical protein
MTSDINRTLLGIGFTVDGNGALCVCDVSVMLTPEGQFYRLEIALPHGNMLTCHVAKAALKTTEPAVDVEALISTAAPARRPW